MEGMMMDNETFRILNSVMQWIIMPVAAFVWVIYRQQQQHETAIAVLQAETATARLAHDREIKEIRETSRAIMAKLDSIEQALRK
tara:strand:+ start:29161 stop:29415 length:255 start_codon:yes stop_codon:yes gene_type:complete